MMGTKSFWLLFFGLFFVVVSAGCSCGAPISTCPLLDCFGECIDPHTSIKHCGACNRPCAPGQLCTGGKCVDGKKPPPPPPACAANQTLCNGQCVDLMNSPGNCGQCGLACGDSVCVNGRCDSRCAPGLSVCGVRCIDLQNDSDHCGRCESPCAGGAACRGGRCEPTSSCAPPFTQCGKLCVDLQHDSAHCGKCDNACLDRAACVAGQCQTEPVCPDGATQCGNECADLRTSAVHCGGCGKVCSPESLCRDGKCQAPPCKAGGECPAGYVCEKATNQCVKDSGCKSDADCPAGLVCDQATRQCIKKASCQNQFDCNSGMICVSGVCLWPKCKTSDDCGAGMFCNTQTAQCDKGCRDYKDCTKDQKCIGGICVDLPNPGEAGSNCVRGQNQCKAGLECLLATSTQAYCFQPCQIEKDCAVNPFRNRCVRVGNQSNGQPLNLCLGYSPKGGKCGFWGTQQALCQPGEKPPLYCDPGPSVCVSAIVQTKAGTPCSKQGDTTPPLRICDDSLGLACSENTGLCEVVGAAKEGEECDLSGANHGGKKIVCGAGMACVPFTQKLHRCHYTCTPGQPNQCSHNAALSCFAASASAAFCLDTQCSQDSDCAFKGYLCQKQGNRNLCLPGEPAGSVGFGGLCNGSTTANSCNTDASSGGDPYFFCLSAQAGNTAGYCSRNCTTDNKCPDWVGAAGTTKIPSTCTVVSAAGDKYCLFSCGQPGQTCPTALTCQVINGLSLCLAP